MKIIQRCFHLLLLTSVMMQGSSCKKIEQAILKDPCADIKFCNIKSFTYPGSSISTPNSATFTYDAFGNPLTGNNTDVGTGVPNLVFKYDAAYRLSEFQRPYSNGIFETWTKYFYDASGRIAYDTSYVFGTITPSWPPINNEQVRRTTYTYDGTCRIIQTSTVGIGGPEDGFPAQVFNYSYNSNGNLILPGVVYDNKVNIHRTNKVFMFVDRDFSMNNPFTAATYNGYSLPKSIGAAAGQSLYFLQRHIDNATFVYQCD